MSHTSLILFQDWVVCENLGKKNTFYSLSWPFLLQGYGKYTPNFRWSAGMYNCYEIHKRNNEIGVAITFAWKGVSCLYFLYLISSLWVVCILKHACRLCKLLLIISSWVLCFDCLFEVMFVLFPFNIMSITGFEACYLNCAHVKLLSFNIEIDRICTIVVHYSETGLKTAPGQDTCSCLFVCLFFDDTPSHPSGSALLQWYPGILHFSWNTDL